MATAMKDMLQGWRTPANLVTMTRLLLAWVPAAVILLWRESTAAWWWATGLFALIVLTDALDGYLARSRNEVTKLGAFLDPLVDKILVVTTLVALSILNPYLWIPTGIIILRELVVTLQLKARDIVVPAVMSGKVKMFLQAAMIVALLIPLGGVWHWVQVAFIVLAVGATIYSWIDSTRQFIVKP